jgi:HAD superfamily hydrolase (TIGR01509 family)
MSSIKNIIFDFGGVILNIDYKLTAEAFVQLGLENFNQIYTQLSQTDLFDEFETGKISADEFIKALQIYIPHADKTSIIQAWNAMLLDLPKQKIIFIQQLRKKYKCLLFSNTNALHESSFNTIVKNTLGTENLDAFFDKVYLSHTLQHRKPNTAGFLHILKDQNIKGEETLFIDDSPQHITGAQLAGLHTLYLPKDKDLIAELHQILEI